jgi:polyhydroxybutyrate depolymerase
MARRQTDLLSAPAMKKLALALVLAACSPGTSSTDAGTDAGLTADAGTDPLVVARPFDLVVPVGYAQGTPVPLVVLLHGFTATAQEQDSYFHLSDLAQTKTFLLALPNGTVDTAGEHYWNADDACCGFGSVVDDVAYLTAVIHDVQVKYSVDPRRIFLVGHSNGAFMAHRMACERSDLIAGIVALAGMVWKDASLCQPTSRVSVLQVHGTLDEVIAYDGGVALTGAPPFPSAPQTVTTWAQKNACTGTSLDGLTGDLDLVTTLLGNETKRAAFSGCPAGAAAELWSIEGGTHIPAFNASWADTLYTWLQAHPKP